MKKRPKLKAAFAAGRQARRKHLSETSAEMKKKARERVAQWRAKKKEKVFEWQTVKKQKRKEKPMAVQTTQTQKKDNGNDKPAKTTEPEPLQPGEPTKVYKGDGVTPDLTGTDKEKKK